VEFAGGSCRVAVAVLDEPAPSGRAPGHGAGADAPLVVASSGIDLPSPGDCVEIAVLGQAHVFAPA